MVRDARDAGRRFRVALWFLVSVSVLGALSACTAVVGGGVVAVLVGVGALTSHCYDYLDVTVFDAQGRKTCAAKVTASRNESSEQFELESCYYTPLSDGHWKLRAALPGSNDVGTVVDVEHANDCTRHVQSVELTLNAAGAAQRALPPAQPPTPVASSVFPPVVAPPSSNPTSPSAVPNSNAAGGTSSSSAPAAAGAASLGVFPNQSDSSR